MICNVHLFKQTELVFYRIDLPTGLWAVGGFIKMFFFVRGIEFTPLVIHEVATAGAAVADIGFETGGFGFGSSRTSGVDSATTSGVDSATASVWTAGELVNARNIRA